MGVEYNKTKKYHIATGLKFVMCTMLKVIV